MPENKKICILSVDGGGIRGVIPATILTVIENRLKEKTGDVNSTLMDYIDLFAGTSTGSILVCGLLIPGDNNRPKYAARDLLDLYKKEGPVIFKTNIFDRLAGGIFDEKYPSKNIEGVLSEYFGDIKLNQLLKPSLISSYDIFNRKSHFFKSHKAGSESKNFHVKDVLRSTTAAPTFFETAKVKSDLQVEYTLIDGGVFVNNPALCAYSEARGMQFTKKNNPTVKDMVIISLGTGTAKRQYRYDDAKNWGALGWIRPLIDIMMSGNSETVDYQLRSIYDTLSEKDKSCYFRLQIDLLKSQVDPEMDNAREENLQKLENEGLKFVADHEQEIDGIIQLLIENKV